MYAIITGLLIALFTTIAPPVQAQDDCGCDHIIGPEKNYIRATDMPQVKPGDVVCIKAGVRGRLAFVGFEGTAEQPIIFKNCGGQVILDQAELDGSLVFQKSRFFHITGTGSPDHKYGFLIRRTKGSAIALTDSDFEIDHVEVADAGFAGIFTKHEALCDNEPYHRGNYVMTNLSIHDNYIHDTHGEGMYIGSSWWKGKTSECGTLYPPEIHGLRVYNNIIEDTGADGLQIGCAAKDVEVYNNVIRRYGKDPFSPVHVNGLMLNGGCTGKYYNNQIWDGAGVGLNSFGNGDVYLYNNLIVRPGIDGIFIDERGPVTPGTGTHTHNNTIVSPGRDGIRMYSKNSVGNTFVNNLIVQPGSLGTNYYNKNHYLFIIDSNVDYSQNNNLFLATVNEALFADAAANNFQLQPESPAVDAGVALSYFNFDLNKSPRPQGASFDIGTYEFAGATKTSNILPAVTAGADQTITLPVSSLSLVGNAKDADGTIDSYSWTKISGPAATMAGQTTNTLSLSNLVVGEYNFRLTATDNSGGTASASVKVSVLPAPIENIAPTVSAGADKIITLPANSLSLRGTATDADGIIAATRWTQTGGPATTLTGTSSLTLNLSNLVEGTYAFRLTATDNSGAVAQDDVQVVVKPEPAANVAPVADAGADQTITLPENSLTLIGKASDEDGSIAYISWTKVNGPTVSMSGMTTLNLKLTNLTEGTYTFKLSVKDNLGAITTDNVMVTVKPAPAQTSSSPGLNYKYYTTNNQQAWSKLPDFSSMTPVKTGIVPNFSLAPKTQNDHFGFNFTGYIEITAAGTYTFFTKSDDGSKLFINKQMIVNNDGTHGVRERNGKVYLEIGFHAIEANYFDKVNGEKLEVSYTGPGLDKQIIPASVLYTEIPQAAEESRDTERNGNSSTDILAPTNLTARLNSNGSVYLKWIDASNNEAGFEIFLSLDNNEDYQPAGSTTADKIQYTVGNLPAGHDYHFKVRAKNKQLYSDFSNVASVLTKSAESTKELGTSQNGNRKIMVNFNYGNNVAAPWNNFDTDPNPQDLLTNMVDNQGNSTTVNITLLTTWGWEDYGGNGHNNYGMSTGDDSGAYPDQVMTSCFWTQRADAEEMLVSGLEPNEYYSFTFFGSRDASGERTTHYSIGRTTVSLDASFNTSKTVTITNAKADANGNLKVYVQKDASAPYGYLNAMVIEATGYTEGFTATAGHRNTATDDVEEAKKEKAPFIQDGFQILSAYPNPAVDHLIVKYDNTLSGSKMQLQIVDLAGNIRIEQEQTATDVNGTIRIDFDRTKIASGYYILRISTETGTKNIKFLKM